MNTLLFHLKQRNLDASAFKAIRPYTQGPVVRQLQHRLNRRFQALGVSDTITVRIDGWFGDETIAAVKYLQCIGGLPVSGHVTERSHDFIINGFAGLEVLSLGSAGTGVLALKQVLAIRSDLPISQDGVFCELTQQAVKHYQRSVCLRADGVVGHRTWAKIVRLRLGGLPCVALIPNLYVNVSPEASPPARTKAALN